MTSLSRMHDERFLAQAQSGLSYFSGRLGIVQA
jgi:hypothetical protein